MVPKDSQPFQGLGAARLVKCNARYHAAAHNRSDLSLLNTYIEPPKTMNALLAFVCADSPGSSSNLSTISTFSLVTYSSPSEAGPKTCRGQMTRPQLILAISIAGVIFALVWVLKMVLDRGRSILPSELPERPQKVSLLDRLSQKTSPSQPTLYGSGSFSAPSPTNQPYLSAWAPSTSFTDDVIAPHVLKRFTSTNSENTARTSTSTERRPKSLKTIISSIRRPRSSKGESKRSFPPHEVTSVSNLLDISRVSPHVRRKPISSNIEDKFKDPLVERFERLKLPWDGKSQPRSVVPAVLPPPSPSSTITSPKPAQSKRPSSQAAKQIWKKMAGRSATEPRLSAIPSAHGFGGDFGTQPEAILEAGSKAKHPIVIDDSGDEGNSNSIIRGYRESFRRRVRADDRMPALSRQRRTPVAQRLSRRSRSPSMSDSGSQDDLTPTSSRDMSYPDLSVHLAGLRGLPQSEHGEVGHPSRNDASILQEELDRQLAERLEREEQEEYRRTQRLYAQLRTGSGQPSMSSNATGTRQSTHQRVRPEAISHQGTRDDPIDLDTDSSSYSEDSDNGALGGRAGVEADETDPMDIDEEGWNSRDEFDAIDTSMDAILARQLQEEEERSQPMVVPTRACVVCDDSHPIPDLPALANCEHLPQTCATCYSGWVTAQLQGSGWREAKCPENKCATKMTYHEIQQFATPEMFQQYDSFIARAAISEDRKLFRPFLYSISKLTDDDSQLSMVQSMRRRPNPLEWRRGQHLYMCFLRLQSLHRSRKHVA
jgi:hypothetical protein